MKRMHPHIPRHLRDAEAGRLSRREFLTRATALGLAAPLARTLMPGPVQAQPSPVTGGILRMQMATLPLCDPRLADWPEIGNVLRGWLEPLVNYHADGTLTGHLLDGWEVSDDALHYTLRLRDNIRWWNGERMTAEDIARNLLRWIEPIPGNALITAMSALREDGVEVVDPLTLRLTLGFPDATLMASLSDYNALIVHRSYDGADPSVNPLGSGPFRPVLNLVGERQVLERTEWWGTPVFGGPWLDGIEYIDLGTDPAQALTAARAGEIDAVDQTVADFAPALEELGWVATQVPSASTLVVRFQQHDPVYADLRVRKAIQMAVSNPVVLELGIGGLGDVGENHHVCPLHPDYAEIPAPLHDPDAARTLLAEAGHAETTFTLISLDDAWQSLSCDAVAAQMSDAGIKVERRVLPGVEYWTNWREFPFSATYWNMRPLGVQVLRMAYRSDAPWNETGFASPAFDEGLDRALSIVDAAERRAVMADLEALLRAEAVMIQPFWRRLLRHATPRLKGAAVTPTLIHHHHEWWLTP